jgi:hypothetical protein
MTRKWPVREAVQMTPAENERVQSAVEFLGRYVEASSHAWGTQAFSEPRAGSTYEVACRLPKGRWAFDYARLHLAAADDHLHTAAAVMSVTLPAYALYTVLRGSLEAAARACWLLQPQLSARQRQERGFTERLSGLQGVQKFKRHRMEWKGKIADLRAEASRSGLAEETESKKPGNPVVGFGIKRPGITELILDLLPETPSSDDDSEGAFLYRFVSGMAHSEPWAILTTLETVGTIDADVSVGRFEVKFHQLFPVLRKTIALHDRAVGWHTTLMGYDDQARVRARGHIPHF